MNIKQVGRLGGKARADNLSSERRVEIAKKAAAARWQKHNENKSKVKVAGNGGD